MPVEHDMLDLNAITGGEIGDEHGLGSLADELADALSDFDDEDDCSEAELVPTYVPRAESQQWIVNELDEGTVNISGLLLNGSTSRNEDNSSLPWPHKKDYQWRGRPYDGSDFSSETDPDGAGFSPSLVAKLDAVDSLARRGMQHSEALADDVLSRVIDELRDLGSQSNVEGSASRLITTHSALTTHLAHQTRQLHNLTFALLSPLASPPDEETIGNLVPLLMTLSEDMPRPSTLAFNSLTALHLITSELIQTLSYLSDTLHMSRQTTASVTRRLKSAKELVAEMRRDDELREQGEQWLAQGNWSERLEKRECAEVCGAVMGGFEDVCNGWRERLLAQAEFQA